MLLVMYKTMLTSSSLGDGGLGEGSLSDRRRGGSLGDEGARALQESSVLASGLSGALGDGPQATSDSDSHVTERDGWG